LTSSLEVKHKNSKFLLWKVFLGRIIFMMLLMSLRNVFREGFLLLGWQLPEL